MWLLASTWGQLWAQIFMHAWTFTPKFHKYESIYACTYSLLHSSIYDNGWFIHEFPSLLKTYSWLYFLFLPNWVSYLSSQISRLIGDKLKASVDMHDDALEYKILYIRYIDKRTASK